jgi:hypothetical protein
LKRICLVGVAVAGLLTGGITTVASAAPTKYKTVTKTETKIETLTKHSTVACKPSLTVQIPVDSTTVIAGSPSGNMAGPANCGTPLSKGASTASYTIGASGDLAATFTQFFSNGTIKGTLTLSPGAASGPPTLSTFGQAAYSGTIKVTGGTEALKGVTGTGTISCTTPDSIHYSCKDSVKLSQTVKQPVKIKVKEKVKVS